MQTNTLMMPSLKSQSAVLRYDLDIAVLYGQRDQGVRISRQPCHLGDQLVRHRY